MARRGDGGRTLTWGAYGVLLTMLFVELFFFAWCRFQCVRTGYEISQAWEERKTLVRRQESMRAQLANLQSPRRIMKIGQEQFGLNMPRPGQVVVIEDDAR